MFPGQGTGTFLFPHKGTSFCTNLPVPQTGNAVPGFCPSVVQSWEKPLNPNKTKLRSDMNFLIKKLP
jgi:hypothetical protein